MNLSRLVLQPLTREVGRAISDVQQMHRLVMAGFPNSPDLRSRAHNCVLYRLDMDPYAGALVLYVQSASPPDWSRLPANVLAILESRPNPDVRELTELDSLADGRVMRFRLRANATRRVDTKSIDGHRRHGRRVPHRDEEHCFEWLVRKGKTHGFELVRGDRGDLDVVLSRDPVQRGHRRGRALTFEGARFDGRLRVVAANTFRAAVIKGIGPAKAYGFGLVSLAPE